MIGRDVVVEAEVVKQLGRCRLNAHHRRLSRKSAGFNESRRYTDHNQSLTFSTVSAQSGHRGSQPSRWQLGGFGPFAPEFFRKISGAMPSGKCSCSGRM
jgi:hypothetical protein